MMNIEELRKRAVALERELQNAASQSHQVAAFANYEPLVSAINRAKAGEINEPEEIPGMYHWHFETGIFWEHKIMAEAFSRFSLLLSGLQG